MSRLRAIALPAGPLLGVVLGLGLLASGQPPPMALTAGLTAWVACWWIFEALPIPLTSLLPLALLPLFGVLTPAQVGQAYGDPLILLLMGGFMLGAALEKSGVHRRLALYLLRLTGGRADRSLVFGFLLAAALASMWISNTATALMLLPIARVVLPADASRGLVVAVLLAIAYGASVGGLATPIGTPPNLIFLKAYGEVSGIQVGFVGYAAMALPVVALFLPVIGWWLARGLPPGEAVTLPDPGPWRAEERRVLAVLALTALGWITRSDPFGGWSTWFDLPQANDASVALLACVALALIPNGDPVRPGRLLDWETAGKIPFGILILFGSGVALAAAFAASGLSGWLGGLLGAGAGTLTIWLLVPLTCLLVTFLTEVTSNTATATLLMPILAAAAVGAGLDPLLLMFPAALSASCAFMLPVATGPNAVVFASGQLSVAEMARTGFAVNLLGVAVVSVVTLGLLR